MLLLPVAGQAHRDWGPLGSPVHLTIGYQPYFAMAWSGVILRAKKFYERYLPPGSTVQWTLGLHGPVILNALVDGREDLGYLGDPPAITAAGHREKADLRIVAVAGTSRVLCDTLLVRADAPLFADADAAIAWLADKRVAAAFGGCSDHSARLTFARARHQPGTYVNLTPTVLHNAFAAHLIDAAMVQEPVATQLIASGLVRRAMPNGTLDVPAAAFLVASGDLIEARPDVVRAWLNAELDAQLFMADPRNASEMLDIAAAQTLGYDKDVLRSALYGVDGDQVRLSFPFAFTAEIRQLIDATALFLRDIGRLPDGRLPPDAVADSLALAVLRDRGLSSPVGAIHGGWTQEVGQ